jgi:2,3-bisphosphoglycerate-dependent phosphoglycerate mutase
MELLLIRHALPVRREVVEGAADPELSEAGAEQARLLADYLSEEAVDAIYASPMRRAIQTATPLADRFGLAITVIEGIAEYDQQASEYVPVEELKAANDPRWYQLLNNEWPEMDETLEQFAQRVHDTIEGIIAAHPAQTVAAVCHGGVINAYLARVLGAADSSSFFYPNYTGINRVAAARTGQRQILTINETAHLRGTGLPIGLYGK